MRFDRHCFWLKSPNERFRGSKIVKKIPTSLPVVAAAITDGEGRLLLHRRPVGKAHAGLWEFPGGKVETNETPRCALVREIAEELGLTLQERDLSPAGIAQCEARGEDTDIVILLYTTSRWTGEPQALEGNEWGWFTAIQARALDKPPLDIQLLDAWAYLKDV